MLNQTITLQLASDLRTTLTRLIKKLRSKSFAGDNLSLTERSTIKLLDEHKELLATELAAMEKITTQSMSQILSHLSELGYITRKVSDTDKRKIIISLSKAGRNILHKARNERDEWLGKAINETLTFKERQMLQQLIGPLTRLADFD